MDNHRSAYIVYNSALDRFLYTTIGDEYVWKTGFNDPSDTVYLTIFYNLYAISRFLKEQDKKAIMSNWIIVPLDQKLDNPDFDNGYSAYDLLEQL